MRCSRVPTAVLSSISRRVGGVHVPVLLHVHPAAPLQLRLGRRRQTRAAASLGTAAADCPSPGASSNAAGTVLFISPVWPERSSSAAGVRTADLIASFQQRGWAAAYASPSAPNDHTAALAATEVATHACPPNREHVLADVLAAAQPTAVVFDRFYAEEAYSFRVRELAPHALRILDMQDFHALRACRQQAADSGAAPDAVLAARPDATAPECLRELAAIHRSDLTLVCSPAELHMLTQHYGVPASKLVLAPFFAPSSPYAPPAAAAGGAAAPVAAAASPAFRDRRHFLMIGNWRHPPNLDSARWAATEIWPALRAALPAEERAGCELHMYGAYAAGAAQQLHRPKEGVHMKGFAPSLDLMHTFRVLLAPLRYGAGLKGKVVDAWWHGLPVVTTPLGAEGMAAADAHPVTASSAAAAANPAAASAAAAADPAAEGYVWQLGGELESSSSSSGSSGSGSSGSSGTAAQGEWGGLCDASSPAALAAAAALLYSDQGMWQRCQQRGFELLRLLYDQERNLGQVHAAVAAAAAHLEERRRQDYVGSMLWSQQLRSTEFFSRWIELKEGLKEAGSGGSGSSSGGAAGQ